MFDDVHGISINGAICGTPHHVVHGATQWCFLVELLVKVLVVILTLFNGVGDQGVHGCCLMVILIKLLNGVAC
jgi:hypothetical protein